MQGKRVQARLNIGKMGSLDVMQFQAKKCVIIKSLSGLAVAVPVECAFGFDDRQKYFGVFLLGISKSRRTQ